MILVMKIAAVKVHRMMGKTSRKLTHQTAKVSILKLKLIQTNLQKAMKKKKTRMKMRIKWMNKQMR